MDNVEFTIIEDKKEYSIVWIILKENSEVCRYHDIPGDISLPYFVSGESLMKLEKGENLLLDDFQLIIGLLLRHNANPPMTETHKIKPYFDLILSDLLREFVARKKRGDLC